MYKYFSSKIKCIGATHTAVSFAAVFWSRHTTPSIPHWRESHCVTRPNNGCKRDYAYNRSSKKQEQNQNKSSTVGRLKNIIPSDFTTKSKLTTVSPIVPYQRYSAISRGSQGRQPNVFVAQQTNDNILYFLFVTVLYCFFSTLSPTLSKNNELFRSTERTSFSRAGSKRARWLR